MHVSNEDHGANTFDEMMQLQVEFQTRLAEETMRYIRRLQGVFEPHAPGTVVRSDDTALTGHGVAGGSAELRLDVENRQRVHTTLTPSLTPLVDASGTTWFPEASVTPPTRLLAPDQRTEVVVTVALPTELNAGTYRGTLVLQGFQAPDIPVAIDVTDQASDAT